MTGILAGVLVGLAVLVMAPGHDRLRLPARPARHGRRVVLPRRGSRAAVDPGQLVTEVATRLRAGASPEAAFSATLARSSPSAVRRAGGRRRAGTAGAAGEAEPGVPAALRTVADERRELAGAVAACRLTHRLGAPLAEVLDHCAHGLAEAERARAARSVALAGPRTTTRLLQGMPLLGLVLGGLVGADPLVVLFDGGLGTLTLLAGAALTAAGHRWTRRLVRAAEGRAGP